MEKKKRIETEESCAKEEKDAQAQAPEQGAKPEEKAVEASEPETKVEQQKSKVEQQKSEAEQQKSETEIKKLKAEAEEYKRKWYLVTAEYENYRKRTQSDCAKRYAEGRADVVKGLFPIADNLERALASCADEGTKKGIGMVMTAFSNLLKEEKIEVIDPIGLPFDAERCEAIMAVEPEEGEESGTVKQVYQKGYLQGGKVLRYAQVVVTK